MNLENLKVSHKQPRISLNANETAKGAGGGSEMWIHDLMKQLINQYRLGLGDDTSAEITQGFYQTLKQKLTRRLVDISLGTNEYITFTHPQTSDKVELEVTAEMCNKAFKVGFKHVKTMIESQLQHLVSISEGWGAIDHIVTIIVSGGSSLHPDFIRWIKSLCMNLSLPEPLFTKAMEMHYG